MKKLIIIAGLTIILVSAFGIYKISTASSAVWPPRAQLEQTYINLSRAHGRSLIGANTAEKIASKFMHTPAEGARFQHCVDPSRVPKLNQDCWVILLNPTLLRMPGGKKGSSVKTAWAIDLISARGKGIEFAQYGK
jgi:hypothetical protein